MPKDRIVDSDQPEESELYCSKKEAWVTLATNDAYALGCLVLGSSLRRVGTTRQLVVMHTDALSEQLKSQLSTVFDHLVKVSVIDSRDSRNLSLLGRPDLNVTYTKIHCWELIQFEKGVFLDADTLVIQNCDELFDREELSAAPDAGWPDCFNSGVFVFRPSLETYAKLNEFAFTTGSFDGGDQGLLNSFFNTWPTEDIHKHLPFIYNVVSQAFYSYLPAFTQFRSNIKIVHFIGPIKPWHHPYNTASRKVVTLPETGHCQEFLQMWWDLFMELVQPRLDPTLTPFIRYEYILPSSHPQHPISSVHDEESSHIQDHQPSFYQVLYPYMPPALEQQFYTPPEHPPLPSEPVPPQSHFPPPHEKQEYSHILPVDLPVEHPVIDLQEGERQQDDPGVPHVVDMPIVSRIFHPFETHYVEEPLLHVDPDSPPFNLYESSYFEPSLKQQSVKEDEGTEHNGVALDTAEDAADVKNNIEKEETSQGGIVGELAQIKIGAGGESANYMILDDRERRLAWERGHADYLGADRFENIMKKLDEKMAPLPSTKDLPRRSEGSLSEVSLDKALERSRPGSSSARLDRRRSFSAESREDHGEVKEDKFRSSPELTQMESNESKRN